MTLIRARKELYLQEKKDREVGKLNGIPWFYTFPKLGKVIPTIPKGYPILWTANSGVGKKVNPEFAIVNILSIFVL